MQELAGFLAFAGRAALARQSDEADHIVNDRPTCEVNCQVLRQL